MPKSPDEISIGKFDIVATQTHAKGLFDGAACERERSCCSASARWRG
jgi:hypothetical protein